MISAYKQKQSLPNTVAIITAGKLLILLHIFLTQMLKHQEFLDHFLPFQR